MVGLRHPQGVRAAIPGVGLPVASRLVSKRVCDRATFIPVASGMVVAPGVIPMALGLVFNTPCPSSWHQGWSLTHLVHPHGTRAGL